MQSHFTVKLHTPIKIKGEIIDEIGFRDVLASDIEQGKISMNEINNASEDDVDTLCIAGLKIARTLSNKPKLGEEAGNLTFQNLVKIMDGFGEFLQKSNENIQGGEDSPNPLPSLQETVSEPAIEKSP